LLNSWRSICRKEKSHREKKIGPPGPTKEKRKEEEGDRGNEKTRHTTLRLSAFRGGTSRRRGGNSIEKRGRLVDQPRGTQGSKGSKKKGGEGCYMVLTLEPQKR